MRVHNLRLGFATNSSSSHSIVILDGKNVVKDCFVEGQEFGGQNFTAATSPSKMAWLGQVVRHSMRKYMPPKAAIFCAKHLVESDLEDDGYCDHQSCLLIPRQHGEMWPDERWIDDLCNLCSEDWLVTDGPPEDPRAGEDAEVEDLFDADPECRHDIVVAPGGGVRCSKCSGWFCF